MIKTISIKKKICYKTKKWQWARKNNCFALSLNTSGIVKKKIMVFPNHAISVCHNHLTPVLSGVSIEFILLYSLCQLCSNAKTLTQWQRPRRKLVNIDIISSSSIIMLLSSLYLLTSCRVIFKFYLISSIQSLYSITTTETSYF